MLAKINKDDKLRARHRIPDEFNHLVARHLFFKPAIVPVTEKDLLPSEFKEDELRDFLLDKDFDEKRINNWV